MTSRVEPVNNQSQEMVGYMMAPFFLRDGNIQFLGNCTHKLVDKTVPAGDIGHG